MLTTMTTTETPRYASSYFTRPGLALVGVKQPCFKMKSDSDWETQSETVTTSSGGSNSVSSPRLDDDMMDLLDRIELVELENEHELKTDSDWILPETNATKRSSRHFSGGGLVPDCTEATYVKSQTLSNFSGGSVVSTTKPSTSSSVVTRISRNPFKNHLKLMLDAEEQDVSSNGCVLSSTNPFSISSQNEEDEEAGVDFCVRRRTPSQCSTRPVSPTTPKAVQCLNPFVSTPRPNSLIFVFPPPTMASQSTQTNGEPAWLFNDLHCLQVTMQSLRLSGWYYENVCWKDSVHILQDSQPGTFLVRDSADPKFLFSLSVQTSRGPTSVRLHYINGKFRLDAEDRLIPSLPCFESVHDLIEFYITNTEVSSRKSQKSRRKTSAKEQVWVDSHGQVYSSIRLTKPMRKTNKIPSLQHLSRLAANRQIRRSFRCRVSKSKSLISNPTVPAISLINLLPVPKSVTDFLKEYPFSQ